MLFPRFFSVKSHVQNVYDVPAGAVPDNTWSAPLRRPLSGAKRCSYYYRPPIRSTTVERKHDARCKSRS